MTHSIRSRDSRSGSPSAFAVPGAIGLLGTTIGLGLAIGGGFFGASRNAEQDVARSVSTAFETVAERVAPAVVSVEAYSTFRSIETPLGQGSGVILTEDGLIATNAHVVRNSTRTKVILVDGRELDAQLVGLDEATDLAVLRIDVGGLTSIPLRTDRPAQVGEWVLAFGNPLGLGHTVTAGIVSARGRSTDLRIADYEDFIQTDAAINPGNSGGPLVDLEGRVIGINTAVVDTRRGGQGIGFAIPASIISDVVDQLSKSGRVSRGYIGVNLAELSDSGAVSRSYRGTSRVYVSSVLKNTPAKRSGVVKGEIIDAINGKPVTTLSKLMFKIASLRPGTEVSLSLVGAEGPRVVKVTLEER